MILQFLISMLACFSFAVLFSAPKSQYLLCALSGALSWSSYLLLEPVLGLVWASLLATLFLTIVSRIFAAVRKSPITPYLVCGIFPLVPGAGIYYTSYYFIMNDMHQFAVKGMETFKIAGAIALGIIFALAIPQQVFHRISKN